MPVSQYEMPIDQQQAVASTLLNELSAGHPITPGEIRHSRSGAPWASWSGKIWYRLIDVPADNEVGEGVLIRSVLDDDGRPLGCDQRGPLMLSWYRDRSNIGSWLPVAVLTNTGWSHEKDVLWT